MRVRFLFLGALCLFLTNLALASPGLVTVNLEPPGPLSSGQTFRLIYRMTEYTDPVEIDGFRFRVSFPAQLFAFVPGSEMTGTTSGQDQQWLLKANQEAGAQQLSLTTDSTTAGRVEFYLRDAVLGPGERGTLAPSGFLVSFQLRTQGEGTGLINATAYTSPQGPQVLYTVEGTAAGVPAFNATFKEVQPGVNLTIVQAQTNVVVSWPTNAVNYVLQHKAVLDPSVTWATIATTPIVIGTRYQLSFPSNVGTRFWRLQGP